MTTLLAKRLIAQNSLPVTVPVYGSHYKVLKEVERLRLNGYGIERSPQRLDDGTYYAVMRKVW